MPRTLQVTSELFPTGEVKVADVTRQSGPTADSGRRTKQRRKKLVNIVELDQECNTKFIMVQCS